MPTAMNSVFCILAAATLCVACATSPASSPGPADTSKIGSDTSPDAAGPANFARGSLGLMVREIGQQTDLSIVLMNGLEFYQVGPYSLQKMSLEEMLDQLTADADLLRHRQPAYDFIHPRGFEALTTFEPARNLDRRVARIETSARFGADTPLYGALALLSHSLNVTLVADNVVAAARCGEMNLKRMTLGDALEAILRSARLTESTCLVQGEGRIVFLASPTSVARKSVFAGSPSTSRPHYLDNVVSLHLPSPPDNPRRLTEETGAVPLRNCLTSMSEQLGVPVTADRRCETLPINPAVMVDVPMSKALELLIRQWPLPHYGYTATEEGVRIVYLGPPAV